jgi:predicted  nucleic acid-binding Zn-ribbon protein
MNFLSRTPLITAKSLNTKTKNILGVFSKAINDLQGVINSAKDQIVVKNEEIKAAEEERHALQNLVDKNEQIIIKLENFVN